MSRQINRWLGEPYVATNSDVGRMFVDNFFCTKQVKLLRMRDEADVRQNPLLFRDVVEGIANDKRITEKFGRKVSTMEVQALLWYMEKALYPPECKVTKRVRRIRLWQLCRNQSRKKT